MQLIPLEGESFELASGWLAQEENRRWLDFGPGGVVPDARSLRLMTQRGIHCLRLFTAAEPTPPVGLVALSEIHRDFRTARLWYVLGEKRCARRGLATRAVGGLLDLAFSELGLTAINAWVVDGNRASIRVLEKNAFRLIGRQRRCHCIGGEPRDRFLYDRLASDA